MDEDYQPLVFDLGSNMVQCGWAGDNGPRGRFKNVLGHPRSPAVMFGLGYKETYVGDAAIQYKGFLSLKYPIENGVVTSVDAIEQVFHHSFYNELRVAPEEYKVLLTEAPYNPRSNRINLTQLMFESFSVSGLHFELPALSSTAYGSRHTALVVDIGEGVSTVSPVVEGRLIKSGVIRTNFAGKMLTNYLSRLMTQRGYYLNRSSDLDLVSTLKENLCYVPLDYSAELYESTTSSKFRKTAELSDGTPVSLEYERFQCPEALFQPSLVGLEMPGIHELIYQAIDKVDLSARKTLMLNILLCGGSTLFPGFADRLHKELTSMAPSTLKPRIIAAPERMYMTWYGASMIATLLRYTHQWITKQDYDEYGPSIAFIKCEYM